MAEFRTETDFREIARGPVPADTRRPIATDALPRAARLLPRAARPHLQSFHGFYRLARDLADDPTLDVEEKLNFLAMLEDALVSGRGHRGFLTPALDLHASLRDTGLSNLYARALLISCRRDAEQLRCQSWHDLIGYTQHSAVPVGRFLLAAIAVAEGEEEHPQHPLDPTPEDTSTRAMDSLAMALQVLHLLRHSRSLWTQLGRCYLPLAWFREAGTSVERLVEERCDLQVRHVIDRVLLRTEPLIEAARPLPRQLRSPGARMLAGSMLAQATAQARRLRQRDPLAEDITLPLWQQMRCSTLGGLGGLLA